MRRCKRKFYCVLKTIDPPGKMKCSRKVIKLKKRMSLLTLKEETFAGRNFRGFAVFSQIRESLFPRNFSKDVIRESFFPRNFLKKPSSANILKKIKLLWHS